MSFYLGVDTSNYTTSVAIYDSDTKKIIHKKQLLPVKAGEKGIRQSDAVFHHTQQIRELISSLWSNNEFKLDAVSVSIKPRWLEDSYMPCFTVGQTVAETLATVNNIPIAEVSHQEGHIVAALYSANKTDLIGKQFIAFHVSGGTTECLFVEPSERCPVSATLISSSSDLKAGQAIDRVGLMLGLQFPCGPALEQLALKSNESYVIKAPSKDGNPSLSGVENKCMKMIDDGDSKENISLYCIKYVESALVEMIKTAISEYPSLPIVFSGGVMSNSILQRTLKQYCNSNGRDAFFATPEFSSDNAAGVAILGDYICKV